MQLALRKKYPDQMNFFLSIYLIFSSTALFSENSKLSTVTVSPLSLYSNEWNDVKYNKCNTAVHAAYMNNTEKNVIYILNLIRSNPQLFAITVLKKYPALSG
jgi:hypothetical protein